MNTGEHGIQVLNTWMTSKMVRCGRTGSVGMDVISYSLAVTLNLDWFQPFSHVNYSVGVGIIYMVILNLPREKRYKVENIILVSVIPGPKKQ